MKLMTWCACLCFLSAACGGTPPAPAPGTAETASPRGGPGAAPDFIPEAARDWARDAALQRFGPANLWEYINGGAEHYLAYGFDEIVTARYRHAGGATATLDVYRMTGNVAAYGIYTEERSPGASAVDIGVEGYAGSDSLRFWSGQSYVKASVAPADAGARTALEDLGREVASRLGEPGRPPSEVALFPRESLVEGSIRYVPADVLGQSFLSKAFQAEYTDGKAVTTLLLLPSASLDAAAGGLKRYGDFLAAAGEEPAPLQGLGDEAWASRDSFYGRIVACRSGQHVLIALGASDDRAARVLITAMLKRLTGPA